MDSAGFPEILGIFYAEFHPTQGPKVIFQVPEGILQVPPLSSAVQSPGQRTLSQSFTGTLLKSKMSATFPQTPEINQTSPLLNYTKVLEGRSAENLLPPTHSPMPLTDASGVDFDVVSEYIIPKPELSNRLVVVSSLNYKIVGYPVFIQDQRYERNQLIFNLCFVFHKSADISPFEPIVRKMARLLKGLEIESEFLSKDSKSQLLDIMEQLQEDLNSYSECQISIKHSADIISLKLFPKCSDPPEVKDHQVPVLLIKLDELVDEYWDMTMQRVIPFINGINSVKAIAILADVQRSLVNFSIQHLIYYGCVKLVDIFQFSNIYTVNSCINKIFQQPTDLFEPVPFATIFKLLNGLKRGQTVAEWIQNYKIYEYPIDIRKLIVFATIHGYISRVHRYPVLSLSSKHAAIKANEENFELNSSNLKRFLDGRHCYDEICTAFGCTAKELDEILFKSDWNIEICEL